MRETATEDSSRTACSGQLYCREIGVVRQCVFLMNARTSGRHLFYVVDVFALASANRGGCEEKTVQPANLIAAFQFVSMPGQLLVAGNGGFSAIAFSAVALLIAVVRGTS